MAEGMNKVILIGNLGADPEIRYTQSSQAVLRLRLATTESFPNKAGERQERTEWHAVTVWGKRAEGLNKILSKGSRICIEGRIQYRQWDDKDGNKRYSTDIIANNVLLLGGGPGRGAGASHGAGSSSSNGDFMAPNDDMPADNFADDDIPF